MLLQNETNQEWRLDVHYPEPERKGVAYTEPPKVITIGLDRKMAREAWEAMEAAEKQSKPAARSTGGLDTRSTPMGRMVREDFSREPVAVRDLDAIAKENGIEPAQLLACIKRDALVRAALEDGRLVLRDPKAKG